MAFPYINTTILFAAYISVTLSGFTKVPSQVRKSGVFVAALSLVLRLAWALQTSEKVVSMSGWSQLIPAMFVQRVWTSCNRRLSAVVAFDSNGGIVAHLYTFYIAKYDVAFTLSFLDLPLLWVSLNYCFELPSINLTTSFGFYGQ